MELSGSVEGFICPHCLVNFASSGKLQHHFLEFHSDSGQQEEEEAEVYRRMDTYDEEVRSCKQYKRGSRINKLAPTLKRRPCVTSYYLSFNTLVKVVRYVYSVLSLGSFLWRMLHEEASLCVYTEDIRVISNMEYWLYNKAPARHMKISHIVFIAVKLRL